ncbi:MAG TPA: ribosome silencing factor [Blastocatellia bacterium]|nr:ribosome silencing factor [Blastocatellia bacterium]
MGQIANSQTPEEVTEAGMDTIQEVILAARAASEKKALEIVVLDLREIASFTDYFLICSGKNVRNVQAIADSVRDSLRAAGRRPSHTEGYSAAEWILLDFGDFIVHAFGEQARRFYDLERLWRDASRVALPDDV